MVADETEDMIQTDFPPPGLLVVVRCRGFCCLAYRTRQGKWVTAFSNEELDNVVEVLPY